MGSPFGNPGNAHTPVRGAAHFPSAHCADSLGKCNNRSHVFFSSQHSWESWVLDSCQSLSTAIHGLLSPGREAGSPEDICRAGHRQRLRDVGRALSQQGPLWRNSLYPVPGPSTLHTLESFQTNLVVPLSCFKSFRSSPLSLEKCPNSYCGLQGPFRSDSAHFSRLIAGHSHCHPLPPEAMFWLHWTPLYHTLLSPRHYSGGSATFPLAHIPG